MAAKKSSSNSRSPAKSGSRRSSTRNSASRANKSASSMVLQLVGDMVGDSLSESVSNLKSKVADQVAIHGEEYLESAHESITDITSKVVAWGKKHPVKTVAAAAALIAVSSFLYATLNGKAGQVAQQTRSKLKAAAANE
ncbi:MAG: hypothetical protein H0W78_00805 [Planctomycetes bacterium]|nr:hypothetical protein [Planctomycetota bacterium]